MVKKFMCKGSGSYMEHSNVGYWVSLEDYIKLRRLLQVCADSLTQFVVETKEDIDELEEALLEANRVIREEI
jgi:hypothetical protein